MSKNTDERQRKISVWQQTQVGNRICGGLQVSGYLNLFSVGVFRKIWNFSWQTRVKVGRGTESERFMDRVSIAKAGNET
jgi:hypothetical protein